MTPIQLILIALIVFLLVGIAIFMLMNKSGNQSKKKIDIIRGSAALASETHVDEKDLQNKRRAEIAKKLKSNKDEEEQDGESKASIAMRLQQAGWKLSAQKFWMISASVGLAFVVVAKILSLSLHVTLLLGVVGLLGLPRFVLRSAIKKRQKNFLEEFSDALDAVVRLLQAGMPVGEAVQMISREFDGPVGEEMSIIYDKQKIGIPLHEAALEGTKRMPLPEMQMFAAGLAIQAQTGSSLSEVLSNLSRVIRARFALKRKVMALSSEAIASACIIGALPPVVAFGLYMTSPGYLDPLFLTSTGKNLLMGAAVWMGFGILVMKQMINFKI